MQSETDCIFVFLFEGISNAIITKDGHQPTVRLVHHKGSICRAVRGKLFVTKN